MSEDARGGIARTHQSLLLLKRRTYVPVCAWCDGLLLIIGSSAARAVLMAPKGKYIFGGQPL